MTTGRLSRPMPDQAAGLRRLLAHRPPAMAVARVVAFAAGDESSGRTLLLTHTAAALADEGARVLLIDEHGGADSLHATLDLAVRGDLADTLIAGRDANMPVQPVTPGLDALAAVRLRALAQERHAASLLPRLDALLQHLQRQYDFILIDAAVASPAKIKKSFARPHGHAETAPMPVFSPLLLAAPHVAMVIAARSAAITRAYALIKQLAQARGGEGFHLAITRATAEERAQAVFRNMAETAGRHLGLTLDYLGSVQAPVTGHFARILRDHPELAASAAGDAAGGGFRAVTPAAPVAAGEGASPLLASML